MIQGQEVTSYVTRFSHIKDEFAFVGVTISDFDMVRIALKGFTEEWKPFIKGIVFREKLLDENRMWDNFIKKELRDEDLHPKKRASNDDMTLAARMKGVSKRRT